MNRNTEHDDSGVRELRNPRHELFAKGMAVHGIRKRAVEDASYTPKGADQTAYRLLQLPDVQARIAYLKGEVRERWLDDAAGLRTDVLRSLKETREAAKSKGELIAMYADQDAKSAAN